MDEKENTAKAKLIKQSKTVQTEDKTEPVSEKKRVVVVKKKTHAGAASEAKKKVVAKHTEQSKEQEEIAKQSEEETAAPAMAGAMQTEQTEKAQEQSGVQQTAEKPVTPDKQGKPSEAASAEPQQPRSPRVVGQVGGRGKPAQRMGNRDNRNYPRSSGERSESSGRPQGQASRYQGSQRPQGSRSGSASQSQGEGRTQQGQRKESKSHFIINKDKMGARKPAPAPALPVPEKKPLAKRFQQKPKKQIYSKEEELEEKLLAIKKKAQEQKTNPVPKSIEIMEAITVADLARKMNLKPNELIGKLMSMGYMATINQQIDAETATILASEYGCDVHIISLYEETLIEKVADRPEDLKPRPPIVTVMGHVDHGKTKLLDAIRKTNVVAGEYGGITQHIGAYQVETPRGKITFLDTPGHAAFAEMRARGSQITDIVILVVAADDGVMPQTLEALDHAKAAEVPIIVAINKIDLPEANPDRIKTQLSDHGLVPEEWGGQTMYFEISALQKKGIDELLEGVLLTAEVMELKANYSCPAVAKVVESRIDQGRGIVATLIIEKGTLRVGDSFVAGIYPGRVRAIFNDKGIKIEEATPSMPVEVIGFEGIPNAGDPFEVVENEKVARAYSLKRQELKRFEETRALKKISLDNLYDTISEGNVKELKVIIKADVHGSVEALKNALVKLSTDEIRLNVIHASAGAINETDVNLASASNAIIIGFNVRPTPKAKELADQEKVEIRKYNIIYKAIEEIQLAMEGMLAPEMKEVELGTVEIRTIFKVPKVGTIGGCYVVSGIIKRTANVRLIRDGIVIYDGKLASLKRFKDDAKEVAAGFECGLSLENWNDLKEGDMLEVYEIQEISRKLSS
ncbi:MAG TPA: translation initiation factor IF-2 [Spirochaetales bacterium]|nr:translation initiation factor IF-2 [Spirochaetales bacterium]